ncbi:MAG: zinc ABC transporter substrate-binding protein [Nocardiopsaceae bacterium]|nr:zinc ABC transporter substrate-binding protein [Nocardiopsaceae bacterium]
MLPAPRVAGAALAVTALAVAGCATVAPGSQASGGDSPGKIPVVAAENVWGSIASQLGGSHVTETSIVTSPSTDPHDYEPTAADARTIASAKLVIINGIGYDPWAPKLISANPVAGRTELTVGSLLGLSDGSNPHQWYSAASVRRVISAITAGYRRLDPADAGYFTRRQHWFEATALARYNRLIAQIQARYAGTPVGASESIVSPLAAALGLKLLTPPGFLTAISEGSEPTAGDKAAIDRQIASRQIKVYIYNRQNATPDVAAQVKAARAHHIPVTTVTETLAPAGATFEQWQVSQLQRLAAALHRATGR